MSHEQVNSPTVSNGPSPSVPSQVRDKDSEFEDASKEALLRKIGHSLSATPRLKSYVRMMAHIYLHCPISDNEKKSLQFLHESLESAKSDTSAASEPDPQFMLGLLRDNYIHLINERVKQAIKMAAANVEHLDHNNYLSEALEIKREPGYMQKKLMTLIYATVTYTRELGGKTSGDENDLSFTLALPWGVGIRGATKRVSCQDNYNMILAQSRSDPYNEAERKALSQAHGEAIMNFLELRQRTNESVYSFAMRICVAFRLAFPYESPMDSISCKHVFKRGLHRNCMVRKFPFVDMIQNVTITFREMYQWFYLMHWLEVYKYSSGPNVLSLNPPDSDHTSSSEDAWERSMGFVVKRDCARPRRSSSPYSLHGRLDYLSSDDERS